MGEHTHKEDRADVTPAPHRKQEKSGDNAKCNVDRTLERRAALDPSVPITVDRERLSFASVVGRPTTSLAITVSNRGHVPLLAESRIEACGGESQFELVVDSDFIQPHTDDGRETSKELSVRYSPKRAGTHAAIWVITTDKGGEQRVELHGTASVLEQAKTEQTLGTPIPELAPEDKLASAREKRGELAAALDSLSHLGAYFDGAAPANDAARAQGGERMINAVRQLNVDVLSWLTAEGIHAMKTSRSDESGAGGIVEIFLMKGVEHSLEHFLDLGGPALASVMLALELGGAIKEAASQNSEAHEALEKYSETMQAALAISSDAQDVATSAILHRYGSTFAAYGAKREHVHEIASVQAMGAIADIQHAPGDPANASYFYDKAREVVSEFRAAAQGWGAATGEVVRAAAITERAAREGFQLLLQRYLAFRIERAKEEQRPKVKEILGIPVDEAFPGLAELDTVTVEGGIDFAEPANIQLNSYRFGGYSDMSDAMRMFTGTKVIENLEMPVQIHLFSAQGGSITIHRVFGALPKMEAEGEAARYLKNIGDERLWRSIRGVTLSTNVIKVAG